MDTAYLFVHYKNAEEENGEQVYFAVSSDGYDWESLNQGRPVLQCSQGEQGARDISIFRTKENQFIILATDLCMVKNFEDKYNNQWQNIGRYGSPYISMWQSENLTDWSEQKLLPLGDEQFGCFWGPRVIYNDEKSSYAVYWSSSHARNDFTAKAVYYSETLDFQTFSKPAVLCIKEDSSIVDPYIYKAEENCYRFLKSRSNPFAVIMEKGDSLSGKYERIAGFDACMEELGEMQLFEAPLLYQLKDGNWCLLLDYFGDNRQGKGYVPFLFENMGAGRLKEASEKFSFPYGFKHGDIIPITMEEYNKLKNWYNG